MIQIDYKPVDCLVEYENNSRTHSDDQVAKIAASIGEFGFTNPILIDGENVIIAGHGRLAAARSLGMDSVPTIVLDHLSEDQKRALVIADNRLAEDAGWDEDLLKLELQALQDSGYELGVVGFDDKELASLLEVTELPGLTEDDAVPEARETRVSRPGDVWLLGDHRVLCGDSTSLDAMRVLCDRPVDMVWTDPPYNVDYEGSDGKKIQNDSMSDGAFREFLLKLFESAFAVMAEGAPIYIAHADSEAMNFRGAAAEAGFLIKQQIIWVKNALVMGRQDYHWQHEPILYGWKPGAAHRWYGDRDKKTVIDDQSDLSKMSTAELRDMVNLLRNDQNGSVIYEAKPKKNGDHPTMKPVRLITHMLKNSSAPGHLVLDVCGGSGSTLIACEKTKRHARLMELDERYCDVIVRRWQDYTGKAATLLSSGEAFNDRPVYDPAGGE